MTISISPFWANKTYVLTVSMVTWDCFTLYLFTNSGLEINSKFAAQYFF